MTGRAGSVVSGPVDPVDALRRIAYRLEADRAESYKVRAFRRAAAAVADTDPDRLADLAATGRLQRLDGVGETTARVVAEALAGEVPAYLVHLEGEAPGAHRGGGRGAGAPPGRLPQPLGLV